MSSSELCGLSEIEQRVLLNLCRLVGPALDVVGVTEDPEVPFGELLHALTSGDDAASPVEVRCAVRSLIRRACVSRGVFGDTDPDFLDNRTGVRLRVDGLVAARDLDPQIGVPAPSLLLSPARGASTEFGIRVSVGSAEQDGQLNRSGVALAVVLCVLVLKPSREQPFRVDCPELKAALERLAVHGLGPKRGPGDRVGASPDTIRDSIRKVLAAIPALSEARAGGARPIEWFLTRSLPIVEVRGFERWGVNCWHDLEARVRSLLVGDLAEGPSSG